MDGYEATRRIKATTKGQATIIIALTASALEEERSVILSEGCDDYVRKPFREGDLFEALARHLGVRFRYAEPVVSTAGAERQPGDDQGVLADLVQRVAGQPPEWRKALRQATLLGYQDKILDLIEQVRDQDPELARRLRDLAVQYDHETILILIERAERES
jgi:DNA-binding response OmpR family regulator